MDKAIAGSKLAVLPKRGHVTLIDQPNLFNRAVSEFLHPITEKK
jgi:pimeloyl-ACP methyl ester carboxylesterase